MMMIMIMMIDGDGGNDVDDDHHNHKTQSVAFLGGCRLPCLLLTGTADKCVPSWYAAAAARPFFPNVRLELINGGNHNGLVRWRW